jgi:hypothetical protein
VSVLLASEDAGPTRIGLDDVYEARFSDGEVHGVIRWKAEAVLKAMARGPMAVLDLILGEVGGVLQSFDDRACGRARAGIRVLVEDDPEPRLVVQTDRVANKVTFSDGITVDWARCRYAP